MGPGTGVGPLLPRYRHHLLPDNGCADPSPVPGHLGDGEQVVKPAAFERSRFLLARDCSVDVASPRPDARGGWREAGPSPSPPPADSGPVPVQPTRLPVAPIPPE